MKRFAAVFLCLAIIAAFVPSVSSVAAVQPISIVKIGLSYGDNGLPGVKLQNVTGYPEGYQVGFYDPGRTFCPLFTTSESKIAVIKDQAIWITSENDYLDVEPSSRKCYIGAYHIQLDQTFSSYEEAKDAGFIYTQMGYQAFPAFINGTFRLRISEFLTYDKASAELEKLQSAVGGTYAVVGASPTCYTFTVTGTDKIFFEFDSYGEPAAVLPNSRETWFNKLTYFGGFEFKRVYQNDITVINVVSMNEYIKGVIPYEVSTSWPIEAQKAQAICAKCYACNNQGKHASMGFDLCNTTDCQVYRGTINARPESDMAVDSIDGMYLTYEGEIAMTYYHSNSGGHTEDVENIWGRYIPYLRGVEDTYLENLKPYSVTLTIDTISEILNLKGYADQKVIDYYVSKRSSSGNVIETTMTLADGSKKIISGDRTRTALNSSNKGISIPSHRYNISQNVGIYINKKLVEGNTANFFAIGGDGQVMQLPAALTTVTAITSSGYKPLAPTSLAYVISGTGSGHHIGMSQSGALGMARQGFTYDQILKFYYTGTQVTYFGN